MAERYDTLIIGGGVAGLATATLLSDAGQRVLLVEARPRLGGRILTNFGKNGEPLELGAEFIHGNAPETLGWLKKAKLAKYRVAETQWTWDGETLKEAPDFVAKTNEALDKVSTEGPDHPFRDSLAGLTPDERCRALHFVSNFHAVSPDEASTEVLAGIEVDLTAYRLKAGYQTLVEFLTARLDSARVNVHCGSIVQKVRWSRGHVEAEIEDPTGVQTIRTERAVVTVPVGLLQSRAIGPGVIRFSPPLREKREALTSFRMGSVTRLVLEFSKPFWEEKAPGITFLHDPEGVLPVWWTSRPLETPTLVAWAGGTKSLEISAYGKDWLVRRALTSLGRYFGRAPEEMDELLVGSRFHDWNEDPFSQGAYSYLRVGGAGASEALGEPLKDTLYFAGEATSDTETGTVEGALASARRVAGEILYHRHHLRKGMGAEISRRPLRRSTVSARPHGLHAEKNSRRGAE